MMHPIEQDVIDRLATYGIKCFIGGQRYSKDESYNWYKIGINQETIIGELNFCKNPIWRISWYDKGKTYHYSGLLLTNFEGLIKRIVKLSLPRNKKDENR